MNRGFTLIEMMVVLAIAAILLAVGMPYLQGFVAKGQARSLSAELSRSIMMARAQAVETGQTVSICSHSGASSPACGTAADWSNGWIAWYGMASAGAQVASQRVLLVTRQPALVGISTSVGDFSFAPTGLVSRATASSALVFTIACRANAAIAFRRVEVGRNGRVTLAPEKDDVSGCS